MATPSLSQARTGPLTAHGAPIPAYSADTVSFRRCSTYFALL
jgi:hypothetical protein